MTNITFELDFPEVLSFMKKFRCDFINSNGDLIIDKKTNTYTTFNGCKTIEDLEAKVLMSISAALSNRDPKRKYLLDRINNYFNTHLTLNDMEIIYTKLCYYTKLEENKSFISKGLPVEELKAGMETS